MIGLAECGDAVAADADNAGDDADAAAGALQPRALFDVGFQIDLSAAAELRWPEL
jgi:hypothetical protein